MNPTFLIVEIQRVRDGGTVEILTNEDSIFYVDKAEKTLHNGYPTAEDNRIKDKNLRRYIQFNIYKYIGRQAEKLYYDHKSISEIKFDLE